MTVPKKINLGSGRRFLEDHLNLDVNDAWKPDIVVDIATPNSINPERRFNTQRFGEITLTAGSFDSIHASHVLEHVPDMVAMMTACRDLLRIGGRMFIEVPYDLSYGAWQDPTHVRALNERSWLYYTDWFWMSGWRDARFVVRSLLLVYSDIGEALIKSGVDSQLVMRTPRAVDVMKVELEKIAFSALDIETVQRETPPEGLSRA